VTDKLTPPPRNKRFDFSFQSILRLIFTVGMILASAAILFFLVYRQREILVQHEWRLEPVSILLSFFIYCIALFLVVWVWASIMDAVGSNIPIVKHFRYYCISNLAKRIPGTIWYIASRAQFYRAEAVPMRFTSLASGVEVAVTTVAGILVSLFFAVPIIATYDISLLWFGLALLIGLVSIHPRVLGWLLKRLGADTSHFSYTALLKWLIGYILVWVSGGVVLYFIGNIITTIEFKYLGYLIGSWALIGVLTTVLFFSPSNLGVTEVGLSLLLSNIMPSPIAVVIAIAARIIIILYDIVWAIISATILDRSNRQI
jgi:glycosyltransferase 2 family protein